MADVQKNFRVKLPPRVHFDAAKYDSPKTFAPVDEADCDLFLENLRKTGVPAEAARLLGRGEIAFQIERGRNPEFAAAWSWAEREALYAMEAEARRRAVNGVEKSIYYKGDVIDTVIEYSDSLLNTLLRAKHPGFKDLKGADPFGGADAEDDGEDKAVKVIVRSIPSGTFYKREEIAEHFNGVDFFDEREPEVETEGEEPSSEEE